MLRVSKITIEGNLKEAIKKAVENIGGFGYFIKKGDRVFVETQFQHG